MRIKILKIANGGVCVSVQRIAEEPEAGPKLDVGDAAERALVPPCCGSSNNHSDKAHFALKFIRTFLRAST